MEWIVQIVMKSMRVRYCKGLGVGDWKGTSQNCRHLAGLVPVARHLRTQPC